MYVRLNIDREIIELNPDPQDMSSDEDDERLPPPLSLRETTRSGTVASSLNNEQSSSLDQYNSSAAVPRHACVYNSSMTGKDLVRFCHLLQHKTLTVPYHNMGALKKQQVSLFQNLP